MVVVKLIEQKKGLHIEMSMSVCICRSVMYFFISVSQPTPGLFIQQSLIHSFSLC